MSASVFRRLLYTYLTIFIAVIGTLSLVISILYRNYAFNEKKTALLSVAFEVNQSVNELQSNKITQNELSVLLNSLGSITNSKIYIVRVSKADLLTPETLKIGDKLEESFLINDLNDILDGRTAFRKKQYSDTFDMHVVFLGVPWISDKGIEGAILLYSPVSRITRTMTGINVLIWAIALLFIFIGSAVIYYNSLRISKPIKRMEQAVLALASGEETEDLPVQTNDEIGRLAETFNFMKGQLLTVEKARREFIANVSHDLRTPLTSINGFIEGMLDGIVKPEDYTKYLLIMQEEVNRLMRLTGDILSHAKIQSGSIRLAKEALNIKAVLDPVVESAGVLAKEKSIEISTKYSVTDTVYADADKLKQVLVNILDNAIKYTGNGGKVILEAADLPDKTQFSVKDNGIGIEKDDLALIFDKFYRADKSRSSAQGGTGLGLSNAKSLVELHGGKIRALSEIGRGTEIVFELPKN